MTVRPLARRAAGCVLFAVLLPLALIGRALVAAYLFVLDVLYPVA